MNRVLQSCRAVPVVRTVSRSFSATKDVKHIPSSTIILTREAESGDVEVLLQQRGSGFMGGAWAFPGGAIDKFDKAFSTSTDLQFRLCALREVFEETGLMLWPRSVAADSLLDHHHHRQEVRRDPAGFATLLEEAGIDAAIYLSRTREELRFICSFVTPVFEPRRFATAFFHAHISKSSALHFIFEEDLECGVEASGGETAALQWFRPAEAVEAANEGKIFLPPPQWYILTQMAKGGRGSTSVPTLEEAGGNYQADTAPFIKPHLIVHPDHVDTLPNATPEEAGVLDGVKAAICYPGDEGHHSFPGPQGARHRMELPSLVYTSGKATRAERFRNMKLRTEGNYVDQFKASVHSLDDTAEGEDFWRRL